MEEEGLVTGNGKEGKIYPETLFQEHGAYKFFMVEFLKICDIREKKKKNKFKEIVTRNIRSDYYSDY